MENNKFLNIYNNDIYMKESWQKRVPAAAVRHGGQALIRKA